LILDNLCVIVFSIRIVQSKGVLTALTYAELKKNVDIRTYIIKADEALGSLGYTEHCFAHICKVAETAGNILEMLGYDDVVVENAKIAGYLHDIGNIVNRVDHSQSGGIIAFRFLSHTDMPAESVATIVSAIGNHDEGTGTPVNVVAAALILADKSDVRRSRVRNRDITTFDIHDRVNYSVIRSELNINAEKNCIVLSLEIDTECGSIMDFFEIFLHRMTMCRKAAERLGLKFSLIINGDKMV